MMAMLRDGSDYWIGVAPNRWPFRVFCARCGRTTTLTAKEFNQLPAYDPARSEKDEARKQAEQEAIRAYWREEQRKIEEKSRLEGVLRVSPAGSPTPPSEGK